MSSQPAPTYGITSTIGQYDGCSDPGCYEDKITYLNEMDQIISLINISESCEQNIINDCTNNPMSDFSWWTDRNGNKMEYWDGNHPMGTKGCKCSLDGSGCTPNLHGDSVSFQLARIMANRRKNRGLKSTKCIPKMILVPTN